MKIKAPGAAVQGAKPELPAGQQDDGGCPWMTVVSSLWSLFQMLCLLQAHPFHTLPMLGPSAVQCRPSAPPSAPSLGWGGSSLGLAQLPVAPDRGSPSRSSCTIPIY